MAGIPNLLMIIMTLLVSKYQELNSSLMILNKMGVKKVKYPALIDAGFCRKAQLFIANLAPKAAAKLKSKSLDRVTGQYKNLKEEIAIAFDLRSVFNHITALMHNQ